MSGKGKRKEDEPAACSDDGGDSDGGGKVPPKKAARMSSDDILVCEISKNRRVAVRNWNGKIMVDIREFYVKDGKQMPGKKGISLTMDQWNILREHIEEINKAVEENSS
ncbi:RNA polymerase II transcriptional coactivator KIWI-like protein [Drosera capensis]